LATDSLILAQEHLPAPRASIASAGHTAFLLLVIAGWSALGYFGAARMRASSNPHRAATYVLTILWEWAVVGYIAWGLRRRGSSLRELIGGRWNSGKAFLKDLGLAAGFWVLAVVVLFFTAIAIHAAKPAAGVRFMLPQNQLEIFLWILTSLTAGICEEIIFRGYFQKQFCAWTGNVPAGVLLSATVFGAGHIYQSGKSAVVIGVYGVLFGILAEMRKSLRPGMLTHAWHDGFAGLVGRLLLK
jgi:membrane protease YdiL (CAAX protease family)